MRTYLFLSLSSDSASRESLTMLYLQLPLIKPCVQFSRTRLSNHLLPQAFAVCVQRAVVGILYNSRVSYRYLFGYALYLLTFLCFLLRYILTRSLRYSLSC